MFKKAITLGSFKRYKEAIDLYQQVIKLSPDDTSSYINIFELQLIVGQQWNQKEIEDYLHRVQNNKQEILKFKMLETVKNALYGDQTEILQQLKIKFRDTSFGGWSWEELNTWALALHGEQKERVSKTIEFFENWDNEPKEI